jgi:hypothetical protein
MRTPGENGRAALVSAGDGRHCALLELSDKLVRGLDADALRHLVQRARTGPAVAASRWAVLEHVPPPLPLPRVLAVCEQVLGWALGWLRAQLALGPRDPALEDVLVLAFHTRWCRGGKGERQLFHRMLLALHRSDPAAVASVLQHVPEFGSWRDLCALLREARAQEYNAAGLEPRVWALFAAQLAADAATLDAGGTKVKPPGICAPASPRRAGPLHRQMRGADTCTYAPQVSLAAKYAPSEHGSDARLLRADRHVCAALFGGCAPPERRQYRQLLARLRAAIAVPERSMCAGRWADIDFAHVPSRALAKYKRAFLNEGVRARECADRAACREHLLAALRAPGAKGVHGKQMFPHELVREAMCVGHAGGPECEVLNAQWAAVRQSVLGDQCALARYVCMADVSGSMTGTPMHVSIALGILLSELTAPPFRDRVLTFSAEPQWHVFAPEMTFVQKVLSLQSADWGYNTDFSAALRTISALAQTAGLEPPVEMPSLLVVSDMQFDEAHADASAGGWHTAHEELTAEFAARACAPPRVVFWNVRANTAGFQAGAAMPGVAMVSGYSPALMQQFLTGEWASAAVADATPEALLRETLRSPAFECVRASVRASSASAGRTPARCVVS